MRFSGKLAGLAVLAAAYVASFLVVVHRVRESHGDRVTIRVCHWQLEAGVREAIDAIIKRYEQLNPRVHVVQIAVPGGPIYASWVQTQMKGGNAPDIAQYDQFHGNVAQFFQPLGADVMQPNPYNRGTDLEGVRWRDTFIDGMNCNYSTTLGDYYSVSLDTHIGRIVYNRPLMKAITGRDEPPRTYRELLATCDKIRAYARAHQPGLVPMANSAEASMLQAWLISIALTGRMSEQVDYQHRLEVSCDDVGLGYLRGDWNFDSPEAAATLREVREYGRMCTPGFWERERSLALSDFVSGRAVMFVAPSWEASNLLALCAFPIAAFRYPYPGRDDPEFGRFVEGPISDGGLATGMPMYLNAATRHRAEALDFLRFMTSHEGAAIFTALSNWTPATVGVQPSAFASQFRYVSEGYYWNCNLFVPSSKGDAQNFISSHLDSLWRPEGTVDEFQRIMRDGLGARIQSDFRQEVVDGMNNLREMDIRAVARLRLGTPGIRGEVLPILSAANESTLCQLRDALGARPSEKQGLADGLPAPMWAATGGSSQGDAARPQPVLAAGWQALLERSPDSIRRFEAESKAADPQVAREARFGEALGQLDRQPVGPAQIAEARRLLAGLAEGGDDDIAQGARFFLARIAQDHLDVPDPVEAARQYGRLVAGSRGSIWAETALVRLAILEIYSMDAGSSPEVRIARAEGLLRAASTPAAQSDIHWLIASAIFHFQLPPGRALPHLAAAIELGRLDWAARADVLAAAAELSRRAGEKARAARYYSMFLKENPIDARDYLIRERLAGVR